MCITHDQINFFKKFGYLKFQNFFSAKDISRIKLSISKIKKSNNKKIYKYFENNILNIKKQNLFRIEGFYDYKSYLRKIINSDKIHNKIYSLKKKNYILFKEKINFKPSGSRSDKLHQDIQGGWLKYASDFLSVVISVDKSDNENSNLIFDTSGNNIKYSISKKMEKLSLKSLKKPKFKKFPLNSGDVIFFNGYIPHKSSKNLSNRSRTQLYITYCNSKNKNIREKYFKDKLLSYPPNNLRDPKKKYIYKI